MNVVREFAGDHPSLLADPIEGPVRLGTDDDQPRRPPTMRLFEYITASDNLTNPGPVTLAFDLDYVWGVAWDCARTFLCATRKWPQTLAVGVRRRACQPDAVWWSH